MKGRGGRWAPPLINLASQKHDEFLYPVQADGDLLNGICMYINTVMYTGVWEIFMQNISALSALNASNPGLPKASPT